MTGIVGNTDIIIVSVIAAVVIILGIWLVAKLKASRLDIAKFQKRWDELQRLCSRTDTWPLAVINADKLLDEALRQSRFKGKTMGERLVSAQRKIRNNDSVWFGHKLRNKLVHEEMSKLYRKDVQAALKGFRDALKDLGALR